jgi:hypothetical protein
MKMRIIPFTPKSFLILALNLGIACSIFGIGQQADIPETIETTSFNPATLMWYESPASIWEEALPVGNGRLGAMVFGKYGEERIQLNEETYYSGGPYSSVVEGGAEILPEIQKLIFEGEPIKAHKLFGRHMMGYPVEQMKWDEKEITEVEILYNYCNTSHNDSGGKLKITSKGKKVATKANKDGSFTFETVEGGLYTLERK